MPIVDIHAETSRQAKGRGVLGDAYLALKAGLRELACGRMFRDRAHFVRMTKKGRWLLLKHMGLNEVVLPFLEDMRLCASTDDNVVACDVYIDGHFGYPQFACALEHLQRLDYFARQRPLFFDIGANIGTHSLYALRSELFSRVVSVEPEPGNFQLLVRNLRMNGFDAGNALNVGLSDRSGQAILQLSDDNMGDHRVVSDAGARAATDRTRSIVLKDFAAVSRELQLDLRDGAFFWIDTQGHEFQVLRGIEAELLRTNAFAVEFWPTLLRRNGTLEAFLELARATASGYIVLQEGRTIVDMKELDALASHLIGQPYPADQLDLLFLGTAAPLRAPGN